MTWLNRLFSLSLWLYPRQFRTRFALEMEEVFSRGLMDSKKDGQLAGYILREFYRLPFNLIGVYIWSMHMSEGKQVAVSSIASGSSSEVNLPRESWGSSIMAGIPHLLMALLIISSEISFAVLGGNQAASSYVFGIGFLILVLGVLIYSTFRGWKNWSASWLVYIFGIGLALMSVIASALPHTIIKNDNLIYEIQVLLIPLLLAYLLYKITCKNRLWGLLAAIPLAAVIWTFFLEFVPSLQKSLAWGWIFLLAFTASVMMMRTKVFSGALLLAMAVPVLGGLPFVYLGVYMGGTLPFSEPGPSIAEVLRQYIPFLMVALALVLGPQLAVKLRSAGYQSAKEGGRIFYRLALGGILLGLLLSLTQWVTTNSGIQVSSSTSKVLLVASMVLFLVGYGLLLWTSYHNRSQPGDNSETLELAALFFPLVLIPLLILLLTPILTGNTTYSWLVPAVEMSWVVATTLVVKE